jgi:hypothetical protein
MRSTVFTEKAILLSSVERTFWSLSHYYLSQNGIKIMPQDECVQLNVPAGAIPQEAMPAAA